MKRINLQLFTGIGVFPVHNNIFKVNINGRATPGTFVTIRDLETFSPSIDGNVEEWTPMDTEGWIRRALTGKGLTFSFSGKRNYGDSGNDYVASMLLGTGQDCETQFEWTLPNGDVFTMDCILNLTTPAGGDTTNIDTLEFELLSDGLPEYTPNAALAALTFVCTDHTTAGATQIEAVSPALTGGSSYKYKINAALPLVNTVLDATWADYTLGDAIPVVNGNSITLVEVDGTGKAKKGGIAVAVVE